MASRSTFLKVISDQVALSGSIAVTGLRAGGEIDAVCTKCKMVLAHTILAVSGGRPARVECNTCRGQHNYRSGTADAPKASTTRESSSKSSSTKESTSRTKVSVDELIAQKGGMSRPYSPKTTFILDEVVSHPTFGTGLVAAVRADKIDVMFRTGTKTLVHGRA